MANRKQKKQKNQRISPTRPKGAQAVAPVHALREFDGVPEGIAAGEDAPVTARTGWGEPKGVKQQLGLKAWDEQPAVNAQDPFVIACPLVPAEVWLQPKGPAGAPRTDESAEPILIAEAGEALAGAELRRTLLGTLIHPPAELAQGDGARLRATIEARWITEDGEETITWAVRIGESETYPEAESTNPSEG